MLRCVIKDDNVQDEKDNGIDDRIIVMGECQMEDTVVIL